MNTFNLIFWAFEFICLLYPLFKIHKYLIKRTKKIVSWLIPFIFIFIIIGLSFINIIVWSIIIAHFTIIMGIFDLIFYFINKNKEKKIWIYNIFSIVFTIIYLGLSTFFGFHVFETTYKIETNKINSSLRIAMIADSHLGNTLNGNKFKEYMEEINTKNPDILVICGDFVDDDTKKEDMLIACNSLSNVNTKYGIYFVFGNHDNGYYTYRDFTTSDLKDELIKNGVTILEDNYVNIGTDFTLIGRKDKRDKNRLDMDSLPLGLDNRYKILLDHQPNDYDNEKNKVDLVLSGHTHGGNLLPVNFFVYAANDQTYGLKRIDNTDFIVTSGISAWGIPFNNCTIQEYVIIDIN